MILQYRISRDAYTLSNLLCILFLQLQISYKAACQNIYTASAGETILSLGKTDSGDDQLRNVIRFSPFFNYQQQLHFDFSNRIGIYSGFSIRNIGLISHTEENFKIKERSYSLGIPIVLKLDKLAKDARLNIGIEGELMFAWKRKIIVGDVKTRDSEWFSDKVNIVNPAALVEIVFPKGEYLRMKYYLRDFIRYNQGLNITAKYNIPIKYLPEYGESSSLFYVSVGTVFYKKKLPGKKLETQSAAIGSGTFYKRLF